MPLTSLLGAVGLHVELQDAAWWTTRSIAAAVVIGPLKVRAELDRGRYPTGIKVTDAELASLNIRPDVFHGDCNYSILPRKARK